jgi:hypothetical protein
MRPAFSENSGASCSRIDPDSLKSAVEQVSATDGTFSNMNLFTSLLGIIFNFSASIHVCPRQYNWYSDWAMGWMTEESDFALLQGQSFFFVFFATFGLYSWPITLLPKG